MSSDVGIVAHVRIVEICHAFLVGRGKVGRKVDIWSDLCAHFGRKCLMKLWIIRLPKMNCKNAGYLLQWDVGEAQKAQRASQDPFGRI